MKAPAGGCLGSERGMTLAEMMVACLIMTVIMAGVFGSVLTVMKNDRRSSVEAELHADVNRVLERVQRGSDGLAGLMKARSASVVVGAGGNSITFGVDENGTYTSSTGDDTAMSVYVFDADAVPGTTDDDELVLDPDTTVANDEVLLCSGVADVDFSKSGSLVTMTVKAQRVFQGSTVVFNASQDIYLRN